MEIKKPDISEELHLLAYSSTLKMQAICSSKMLGTFDSYYCENFKSMGSLGLLAN
jgi:hypothetical protein